MSEPTKHRRAEPKRAARTSRWSRAKGARIKGTPEESTSQVGPDPEAASALGLPPEAPTQAPAEAPAEAPTQAPTETPAEAPVATESSRPSKRAAVKLPRPSRFPWLRTRPGLLTIAAIVVGLALLTWFLVTGDDDSEQEGAGPGIPASVNGTKIAKWTTESGSTYEISIKTLSDLSQGESDSGCLPAPPAGMTNLRFRIVIANLSESEADVPEVEFGSDIGTDGVVDSSKRTFDKSNKSMEIGPLIAGVTECAEVAKLSPDRGRLPAGGVVEYVGSFGPVKVPVTTPPTVIYRHFAADGDKSKAVDLLAPFDRL